MTAKRVGPKTDPQRAELRASAADRTRALKALDQMLAAQWEVYRWRQIAAWTPQGERYALRKARERADRQAERLVTARAVVWAALGYDPAADDDPPPRTHWDKGAMED